MHDGFNPLEVKPCGNHKNICKVYGIIVRNKHVNILLEYAGELIVNKETFVMKSDLILV